MKRLPKLPAWQWILIAFVLIYALDWFMQRPDSEARALNDAIAAQGSEALKHYPYPFRVLRVDKGKAIMATPRSFEVPATKVISILFPGVNVLDNNDPAFIAAQQELARLQSEARDIVAAQPGVGSVRWEIDRQWLGAHGVDVPAD
ncbi:glutamate-ammonia-ligase adenylyltransferase [Nitrogeniibacter mangrovi]|uniref:Glutamate-ammonia-ligase adenylyltransferase n=1 Tax=Nitrogeniibacter mangrovi TaxID=2016596 RepID=A0A6C1B2G6_9RHOO|nr:glutamate-ammonia-ligase adenylyltransferase [Nitrogeniibacter mangrovi]QID17573.1 glutamate-ammonia-ligase adenylyltransferase [Nitrogeniibacter mangrovi]